MVGENHYSKHPFNCLGTGRARTMRTCILCLVEYSLDQDEPWFEGTIIPNTMRRDRTRESDVYMYLLFSGVQLGPERAVVGGDHYTKHMASGRDERG